MSKTTMDHITRLWANSAEAKGRYLSSIRKQKQLPASVNTAIDNQKINSYHAALKLHLVQFFTMEKPMLDDSYTETLHLLYKELQRDRSYVFVLLEDGFLLIVSRLPFGKIPRDAVLDHISIFDILLTEITKTFDDCSLVFGELLQHACKVFGFLLINGLKISMLTAEGIDLLLTFSTNLAKYLITMTPMVDYWFDIVMQEPDMRYLFNKSNLTGDVFPLYEIAKGFMFLDERLSLNSQTILYHIVLITGSSENLRDWLLQSDFPSLVVSGLHPAFNNLYYKNEFQNFLCESNDPADRKIKTYVKFIQELVSFASHDIIRVVFVNCLKVNFIDKALASYVEVSQRNESALRKILHILILLVTPSNAESNAVTEFIADELSEEYFEDNYLHRIIISCLEIDSQTFTTETKCIALELITLFYKSGSEVTKKRLFFKDSLNDFTERLVFSDSEIPLMVKLISDSDAFYQNMLTKTLNRDFESLSKIIPYYHKALYFDPEKPFSALILFTFINFFQNDNVLNSYLARLLCDLNSAKYGIVEGFFFRGAESKDSEVMVMTHALNYNWKCYNDYLNLRAPKSTKFTNKIQPDGYQLRAFQGIDQSISSMLSNSKHVNLDCLAQNLEIFRELIVNLYGLLMARKLFPPFKNLN